MFLENKEANGLEERILYELIKITIPFVECCTLNFEGDKCNYQKIEKNGVIHCFLMKTQFIVFVSITFRSYKLSL